MISPLFLVTVGFLLFCAYMARHAVLAYQKANASHRWPAADGVLTDVRLWGTRNIDGEMIAAEKLSVAYEYDVDDVRYSGRSVAFYQLHYPETLAFAKAHPQGSPVKVFYNRQNFGESVLVTGAHPTKPYGGVILAFSSVLVSVAVSIAAWMGALQ